MVQIVCSNVEKHSVKMMAELNRMKQEKDHCDFIIQVGNDVYYAHKNVLSAGSDYFKAMLKHDTRESREGKVVFKDVDFECVKNCIDFMYSGKFEIMDEKMYDLLHVAIMMQLEDLKQAVSNILEKSITVENYFSTRNVADIYRLDAVLSRCRVFFHANITKISNQPEFGNIAKTDILNSVKSERSELCEEEKMTLLLKWVEKNQKNEQHLQESLEAIKFEKISPTFLEHHLESNLIIINDLGLYKLLNGHLVKALKRPDKTKEEIVHDELIILLDDDTDCMRSFNPMTDEVENFHDENFINLIPFETISVDSYIYVLCQNKSVYRLNFRIKNSKWEKIKDMIYDHGANPRSVCLSGSIFLVGGSYLKATSDVETFVSSLNRWFRMKNKPEAISYASLASLNDSIYCVGGEAQDGVEISSFCRFTPSSSEWVDLEPMRYPVRGSGVVAFDQKIFVIGGCRAGKKVDNVECYDVTSAQWTSLSSMNACHEWVSAHRINNWIFAVSDFETSNGIEKYDISRDKWTTVKPEVDQHYKIYGSTLVRM